MILEFKSYFLFALQQLTEQQKPAIWTCCAHVIKSKWLFCLRSDTEKL